MNYAILFTFSTRLLVLQGVVKQSLDVCDILCIFTVGEEVYLEVKDHFQWRRNRN